MRTDLEIRRDLEDQLDGDPQLSVRDIAVSVRAGVVMLAGFVRSFGEKAQAEAAAGRVVGVIGLANDISVRLPLVSRIPDPDIARRVVAALQGEMSTFDEQIRVRVMDGRVTLEGTVECDYQRGRAQEVALAVRGVRRLRNDIVVKPPILPLEIQHRIEFAFERNAEIDANAISVETADHGTIILKGSVRSWAERVEAERVAGATPGVRSVENRIEVVA
jgi:osmotically-inducible protein OsmY